MAMDARGAEGHPRSGRPGRAARWLAAGGALLFGLAQPADPGAPFGAVSAAAALTFTSSCALPAGSVKRSGSTTRFTLRHGDVGGCRTDARARHGAPYWERAELKSGHLGANATHEISFDVRFDPDTRSSDRTTFFQIHTASKDCLDCYPPLMLKVHGDGRTGASLLSSPKAHSERGLGVGRKSLASRWARVRIVASTVPGRANPVQIWIDGRRVLSAEMLVPARGRAFLKYGLYRPGNRNGLPTDSVSIRNVSVSAR